MGFFKRKKRDNVIEKKDLGIYLHIPFCMKKCDYCDFLSMTGDESLKKAYVDALVAEIKSYKEIGKEYLVRTVFIGGGTPSSIEAVEIERILMALRDVFEFVQEDELELTIEANPGTLSEEKLVAYRRSGINRLSIGLQSADNDELRRLGRIHTYEEFEENYRLARDAGFTNINVDLISCLPDQSVESYKKTLYQVAQLKPEHISAYSLIIEESTPFYDRYYKQLEAREKDLPLENLHKEDLSFGMLPSEEKERNMYHVTRDVLGEYSYNRYEISNYAKEGYECRHNSSYWVGTEYLGLGLGASSLLGNMRFQNVENMSDYLSLSSDHEKLRRNIDCLEQSQIMEEFMFLGLRLTKGVSKTEFKERFQTDIETVYGDVIQGFIRDGLLLMEGDRILLTEQGIDLSNYVMSGFIFDTFVRS